VNLVAGLFPLTAGENQVQPQRWRISRSTAPAARHRAHVPETSGCSGSSASGRTCGWRRTLRGPLAPRFFSRWLGGQTQVREEIAQLLEFSALGTSRASSRPTCPSGSSAGWNSRARRREAEAPAARRTCCRDERRGDRQLRQRILDLRARNQIVLIEHVMELVMGSPTASRCSISAEDRRGTPAQVQNDPAVKKAYLGGPEMLTVRDLVTTTERSRR